MVVNFETVGLDTVSAVWVFSTAVADLDLAILILENFNAGMVVPEVHRRDVGDYVPEVRDTVMFFEDGVREFVILVISYSGLTEVDQGGRDAVFLKRHGSQLGESCS